MPSTPPCSDVEIAWHPPLTSRGAGSPGKRWRGSNFEACGTNLPLPAANVKERGRDRVAGVGRERRTVGQVSALLFSPTLEYGGNRPPGLLVGAVLESPL